MKRLGVNGTVTYWVTLLAWFVAYIVYRTQIDPAAAYIENDSGLGRRARPAGLGWAGPSAALFAGVAAFVIGKISLGLRTRLSGDRHHRHVRDHPRASSRTWTG